jgi:hypothetical protein
MLKRHCANIWNMPVDAIGTDEVLSVIQPLWLPHNVTGRRVMHRISQVIRFSHVKKWRPTLAILLNILGFLNSSCQTILISQLDTILQSHSIPCPT